MFDVLVRALQHPLDYWGALRTHTLSLQQSEHVGGDIWTFDFSSEKPLSWPAGQHAIFSFPDQQINGKSWRPFSIASSEHEKVVKIGTHITDTPSDFKQHLKQLKPGDPMHMRGPFGEFHIKPHTKKIIGIAGGIGITPFRALAYDIAHGHITGVELDLIYGCNQQSITFKDELDQWVQQSEALSVTYAYSVEETQTAITNIALARRNTAEYFISGSPRMIKEVIGQLTNHGISYIVTDPFTGYT